VLTDGGDESVGPTEGKNSPRAVPLGEDRVAKTRGTKNGGQKELWWGEKKGGDKKGVSL